MQDDTRTLLKTGSGTFFTGVIAALLMYTIGGGITNRGPHTNSGWLFLMIAMGCLPCGSLMLLLGLTKLAGDRNKK